MCWARMQVDAQKYNVSKAIMLKRIYIVHSHVKFGFKYGLLPPVLLLFLPLNVALGIKRMHTSILFPQGIA